MSNQCSDCGENEAIMCSYCHNVLLNKAVEQPTKELLEAEKEVRRLEREIRAIERGE